MSLWPECPDAPIVIPVQGKIKVPKKSPIDPDTLGLAFVIGLDSTVLTATLDGIPVERPHYQKGNKSFGSPLVQVQRVEPGQITGSQQGVAFQLPDAGLYLTDSYSVPDGPAVWLRGLGDTVLPHRDAGRLAWEIERRRWRIARFGGFNSSIYWEKFPYLRRETPEGFAPGDDGNLPELLVLPKKAEWHGGAVPGSGEVANALAAQEPILTEGVAYPEDCADYEVPISVPDGTRLSVSVRRLFLAPRSLVDEPAIAGEPQIEPFPDNYGVRPDFLDLPFAAAPVIMAGNISGLTVSCDIHSVAPDAQTKVATTVKNGPAVWLWGPKSEWLLCTPDAEKLAADWRERRRIGCLFPISSIHGAERKTWVNFPELKPIDLPRGRAMAPPPSYAPAAPTILPPGHWTPAH